jgi:hypothetical protein
MPKISGLPVFRHSFFRGSAQAGGARRTPCDSYVAVRETAYALGQVLFGLLGLLVARQALDLLGQWPAVSLGLAAAACWLMFSLIFMEYWEPKVVVRIFGALAIAAAITA